MALAWFGKVRKRVAGGAKKAPKTKRMVERKARPPGASQTREPPDPGTRDRMVAGAARLLAQRGLQATSFSEVLQFTASPRGSVYHHFPVARRSWSRLP